jgi:hypothetical protein
MKRRDERGHSKILIIRERNTSVVAYDIRAMRIASLLAFVFVACSPTASKAQMKPPGTAEPNNAGTEAASDIAVLEAAVASAERDQGPKSPEYINALARLASRYRALSRAAEAEPLDRRALALSIEVLGEKHPSTLVKLNNLASSLFALDRTAEAEPLFRRALMLKMDVLGEKNASTLASLNNLTGTLRALDRWAEAEALDRRALAISTEMLGEKHGSTVRSLNNLADDLRKLGRAAEAEPLHRRALALSTEMLGEQHVTTLGILASLTADLRALGRAAEAEPLDRHALAISTEALGERQPVTIAFFGNLADDCRALGRAAEAEMLDRRALALATEVYGEKHRKTITILHNLGGDLNALGRVAEAEPLHRRALAISVEVLGEKHRETLVTLNVLAGDLRSLGRPAEAEPMHRRALALSTEVMGEKHPYTLASLNSLAADLRALGRTAEAEPLHRRALALTIEVLGDKHPDTILVLNNLAADLRVLGRAAEAEQLHRRVLALETDLLGEKHQNRLINLGNLTYDLLAQPARAHLALALAADATNIARAQIDRHDNSPRADAQLARDAQNGQAIFGLFADAAWIAAEGLATGTVPLASLPADLRSVPEVRRAAFAALQYALIGTATETMAREAARGAAHIAGQESLAIEQQKLTDAWRANDLAQNEALGGGGDAGNVKLEALQNRATEMEGRLSTINEQLQASVPDYFKLLRPAALDLTAAQRLLAQDEAVLLMAATGFGTHVMALTSDGLLWHRAPLKADTVETSVLQLASDLASYRQQLSEGFAAGRDSGPDRYDRKTAYELYHALIEPVAGALVGKRHLFIAAAGDLASLPFDWLVTAPPTGTDDGAADLRSTAWLADRFAITQVPSLPSLALFRTRRRDDDGNKN